MVVEGSVKYFLNAGIMYGFSENLGYKNSSDAPFSFFGSNLFPSLFFFGPFLEITVTALTVDLSLVCSK